MNRKMLKGASLILLGATALMFSSCSKQQQQQQAGAPEIATMTVALGNSEVERDRKSVV